MSRSILVESSSVWQLWNPSLSKMTVQYRWWTTPHNVYFFYFIYVHVLFIFFKVFLRDGERGQWRRCVGFQNKSLWVEYFKIKRSPLPYNIWVWRMPLSPVLGRHICGREGVWKLCVIIWLPFAFLGGTMEHLMSGQTGACAACTLSTQYQDLKVFLLWTVELLRSCLGWTVDLWNHPPPNRVWWKAQQSRWRAELRCEKIFLDPIVY